MKFIKYLFLLFIIFSCNKESESYEISIWFIGGEGVIELENVFDPGGGNKPTLGLEFGGVYRGIFPEGYTVSLKVIPDPKSHFKEWGGDWNSNDNPLTLTINRDLGLIVYLGENNPLFLDDNGVTIKCHDWGTNPSDGTLWSVNGKEYRIVYTLPQMEEMNRNGQEVCTSKITGMTGLFRGKKINIDISSWDTSNVQFTGSMFVGSNVDEYDISKWDLSKVINSKSMFEGTVFNGDISNWDVSNVIYMDRMFYGTSKFNRDLSNWNVSNVTNCSEFSKNNSDWTLPKPNFTKCDPN